MNNKKKTVVVSLLLASLLGVGAATAFVTGGDKKSTQGTVDQVVYLDWGETKSVDNISDLTDGNPVFRTVSLAAPVKSDGATGYGTPTFKLELIAGTGEDESLEGVTIKVSNEEWKATTTAKDTVTTAHSFAEAYSELTKTYYLKFEVTSKAYAKYVAKEITMSGSAKLSYTFVEAK